MRFLVVGLGSMGKRRIRNLQALDHRDVAGMDPREDRRQEAHDKYSVPVYAAFDDAIASFRPDAVVISTPPDRHMDYAYPAVERGLPCFIEASVVDADRIAKLHDIASRRQVVVAPSCTMRYFSGPRKVKELVLGGAIGKAVSFNYQTGQYLRDWHPWEKIEDFYVSQRATGGAREIVPFELTWLNDIFGVPAAVACMRGAVGDLAVDIDDIYHCWLRYPGNVLANITVEVLSRPQATRELRVLGTRGEIVFSADENVVRVATTASPEWVRYDLDRGRSEQGYINPEEPYIEEMRAFVSALRNPASAAFPNSLLEDYEVLKILNDLESLTR